MSLKLFLNYVLKAVSSTETGKFYFNFLIRFENDFCQFLQIGELYVIRKYARSPFHY